MNRVNATDPVLVIVLILIGAAIAAVLLYGLWRRAHNPNRVEEYDERQRTARLLAYRAAFWTVMVFLGVSALVKAAVLDGGGLGGDAQIALRIFAHSELRKVHRTAKSRASKDV